jgi:hypothetical protein
MLDSCRHMQSIEFIERTIDLMALYKLNRFHWHLTEDQGWRIHMERTPNLGVTWEHTPALNDGKNPGLIQPTILKWPSGRTQILCRSRQKAQVTQTDALRLSHFNPCPEAELLSRGPYKRASFAPISRRIRRQMRGVKPYGDG